jgi:Tfp pilus assembly protein PilX
MRETRRNDGKRHDRGFAIVMVLFVIGLLLVLGSALTMTAVMNSQNTVGSDSRQRAYNTAESGVADVITAIENVDDVELVDGQHVPVSERHPRDVRLSGEVQ